jgi:Permeases of the major facilitator superfamily
MFLGKLKFKLTARERAWVLYDVANSAFVLMVSTILPILSNNLAMADGYSANEATARWSYVVSATTLIFVFLGPILGAFADIRDQKKRFFIFFVALGVGACALTGLMPSWTLFLAMFAVAKVGFNGSLIFYDSMLTDITEDSRMDTVSSLGFAYGYIGSCIPFVISLGIVMLSGEGGLLPISSTTACILALLVTATWWMALSTPLLGQYKQVFYVEKPKNPVRATFTQLWSTIKNIRKHRQVFIFLLAFFFYIDGVYTIIEIATPYGLSLGLDSTQMLLALLMTQIIAFPCAILFGRLAARIATRKLLQASILFYVGVAVFAFFMKSEWQFWVLAALVGTVQGGVQALSRSYYAKLIPKENSNEFFGFYDIFGKGASVVGTFLMGLIIQVTDRPNLGVIPIAVMFVVGFIVLTVMPKTTAD